MMFDVSYASLWMFEINLTVTPWKKKTQLSLQRCAVFCKISLCLKLFRSLIKKKRGDGSSLPLCCRLRRPRRGLSMFSKTVHAWLCHSRLKNGWIWRFALVIRREGKSSMKTERRWIEFKCPNRFIVVVGGGWLGQVWQLWIAANKEKWAAKDPSPVAAQALSARVRPVTLQLTWRVWKQVALSSCARPWTPPLNLLASSEGRKRHLKV